MAPKQEVIVVGAGIGGLAAALGLSEKGHKVTVFESSPEVSEIGAGIQVTPNFTRILIRWGLGPRLEKAGVQPQWLRQLRWKDGTTLTQFQVNVNNRMANDFGYPYYHIHRIDLQSMLLDRALELGAVVRPGSTVVDYRHENGREVAVLKDGTTATADLIIGADGIRGLLNSYVLGSPVQSIATGDSAYRALLTAEQMSDPIFASLDLKNFASTWLGPERHVVGYYVRDGQFYNVVILVPDPTDQEVESWKLPGDMSKLRSQFRDWDPRLRKILSMIDESFIWKLRDRPALTRWLHPEGNLVLLGDAAHPMLPYIAQGASSAVEDAAALATCLDFVTEGRSVRDVLAVYEELRIPRTVGMREAARANKEYFHLPDGPLQEARDTALRNEAMTGETPNQLGDSKKLAVMYGYDIVEEVKKYFAAQDKSKIAVN